MITRTIKTTNPLIYNITLKIGEDISQKWLAAMKTQFLPHCTDGTIIVASQVSEILVASDDKDKSYSIQFIFASKDTYDKDGLPTLGKFLKLLDGQFLGQYVYFTTKMEVLHECVVQSEN